MLPGSAHHTQPQPEAEADNVSGRPDSVDVFVQGNRPIPATAVRAITPERERRTTRLESVTVYVPSPSPEMSYFARCFAYAYITAPASAAAATCKAADPATTIRRAIHAVLPGLQFELLPACYGADKAVRFSSPDDREAAMEKQPFALPGDDGAAAASVKLVREGETSNIRRIRTDCLAHVALLHYPKDQRNEEDIRGNCSRFGLLLEVDPACFAAPDLSPVRVVVELQHPREIPLEVRIRYSDFLSRHVVPVQILKVWDRSSPSTPTDSTCRCTTPPRPPHR